MTVMVRSVLRKKNKTRRAVVVMVKWMVLARRRSKATKAHNQKRRLSRRNVARSLHRVLVNK